MISITFRVEIHTVNVGLCQRFGDGHVEAVPINEIARKIIDPFYLNFKSGKGHFSTTSTMI